MNRLYKALGTSGNLALAYLTWRWLFGGLNLEFGLGCLVVSTAAICLIQAQLKYLLRNYFNQVSRLQIMIPMGLGVLTAALGLIGTDVTWVRFAAVALLACWGHLYWCYRRNQRHFITQGNGPLPKRAWVNPPKEAVLPGDIALTSGCVAEKTNQSVGHAEHIDLIDGELRCISSWMGLGMVNHPMERIFKDGKHHRVVLRPVEPWTAEDIQLAEILIKRMMQQQQDYIVRTREAREHILSWLPLSESAKERLRKRFPIDGYNWMGLISGGRTHDHWTCIGLVQELNWRMGRRMRWLGTGLFGLGTGILDPLAADRLLYEPSLRLLTEEDRLEFEAKQANVAANAETPAASELPISSETAGAAAAGTATVAEVEPSAVSAQ